MSIDSPDHDPYLWLEDVLGERALAWVHERKLESEAALEGLPGHAESRERILRILDSREQIPYVVRRGPALYNFWRDAMNPRGLWRRTTLAQYRRNEPDWETVLDLDALAAAEGENWVWAGATAHGPQYRRCMLALSRGGSDATVLREFDTVDKRFVDGGFRVAEAKTRVEWLDADHLYLGSDFGPGSLTDSGYPRTVRRWARGTPLAQAPVVFEGERSDVSVSVSVDATPGFERITFERSLDFYRTGTWLLRDEALLAIDKPDDAALSWWREWIVLELRSDWELPGGGFKRGSLLVADAARYLDGERRFDVLFTPTPRRSLSSWSATRSTLLLDVLDQVASRLEEWTHRDGQWQRRLVDAPHLGSLSVAALHDPLLAQDPMAEDRLLNYADFLTPDSLLLGHTGSDERALLKSRPSFFDAHGMRVEQHEAGSADGARVPYFIVWPRDASTAEPRPTLLYGYGGFELAQTPSYSGIRGTEWLARGGVFVLANIRGGGEFGPAWHQAAVKACKQRSYDDFIAVAEDLIARGITSAAQLGIQGGSNGGLLVGAVMLQRPDLFKAVVCQVPLLDMRRYHRLLAGASWKAEFGDPDDPRDWQFISRYSPYQNVPTQARLPSVLLTTSTRDDRVHPGHARKMAARLRELGHPVLYWENTEGGHAGAADNRQIARMKALEFSFLWRELARR